jgi:uncharacterized protein YciI
MSSRQGGPGSTYDGRSRANMKYFVLFYDVVDDMVNKRVPYREEHLRLIREAHGRGEILMGGAVGDPPDGAVLVFRADTPAAAEAFATQDPYVRNGLVTNWTVKPWTVVAGP